MSKLYVREGTLGVFWADVPSELGEKLSHSHNPSELRQIAPWGAPTGRPRGRPVTTGQYTANPGKLNEYTSRVRILELDAIIRSGRKLRNAG